MHASAVEFEGRLIVFIGESGTGKSTLAGNFHQAGQTVVSDDCLRIQESNGQIVAVPSYGGLRLWEDSLQALFSAKQNTYSMAHYTTKKRVQVTENDIVKFGNDLPILAVIVLSSPGTISLSEVTLDRLSHREAFIAMLKQTFQLNVMDLERMTRHMRVLGQIVPKLPAYRMSMPHDYALLPLARQKILEAVV